MNGTALFFLLMGIYLAVLAAIGIYFNRRQRTETDFWLAGRQIGVVNTGFSAAASWLTAGALLAVIGFFMLSGMGSIWGFVAPNIAALLIIALLTGRIRRLDAVTQPELLEKRYGCCLRAPVAIIITVVMTLFAVADIKGFAMVLQAYYGLDPVWAALIVGTAVSVYVTLGGFSAVIWTDLLQFVFLAAFALVMAGVTVSAASHLPQPEIGTIGDLLAAPGKKWWNPLSVGFPMVLILCLAILPGWISEQDPWQRVWAAKSDSTARRGMVLGALLIFLVFAACAVVAMALNRIYPEIAAMGFPAGMARAESALLDFIRNSGSSDLFVALTGVGLAAAAMSCADTFATSGASCLSRDLYRRHIRPGATTAQTLRVNRVCVLIIVATATAGSFVIQSIIDAIHIATFIASAAYFFPLMGGLFWRRATGQGALAALVAGATTQTALVAMDLIRTAPEAAPYLQTRHPCLMGHGVILGMAVSGTVFILVSLATAPTPARTLAQFFPEPDIERSFCETT